MAVVSEMKQLGWSPFVAPRPDFAKYALRQKPNAAEIHTAPPIGEFVITRNDPEAILYGWAVMNTLVKAAQAKFGRNFEIQTSRKVAVPRSEKHIWQAIKQKGYAIHQM